MKVELSEEEIKVLVGYCKTRIDYFSYQYHSLGGSINRLKDHIKNYAEWAEGEREDIKKSCEFWENLKKKLEV